MILYHGSNIKIKTPKIIPSKRLLDFGMGFYLTSDFEQARKWAVRTTSRRESGIPTISMFSIVKDSYDIVMGPVANHQAIRTINNYLKDYFNEDIAIQLLLPQNLKDQFVFKTERALSVLKFSEVKFV